MASSRGLIALIALACLDLSFGQNTAEVCTDNQCPGLETCYNRNVQGQPPFVCECDSPNEMGFNCLTQTSATDADIDEIFTCYGSQCSSGTFSSPGWPTQVYSARYGALYLLYIPGASRIDFSFDSPFAIEELKDELYVGPGLTYTIDQLDGQTVENDHYFFEGSTVPQSFSIESDTVWMVFLTDKNVQLNGFQIRWSTADNTGPVISGCPANIVQTVELGVTSAVITWAEPTATDESGFVELIFRSHVPNTAFSLGPTTVSYIFQDGFSNSAFCNFEVTINTQDTTPPTISNCPSPQSVVAILGTSAATVTWIEPTATDLSGTANLLTRSHIPGSSFSVGTTTVMYTFVDGNGLTATCSFNIVVTAASDNTMPVISNCPANIERTVSLGTTEVAVSWTEPTATDDSGTANLVVRTAVPGSNFAVGPTTVTYVFSDSSGNNAICQFTVTVSTVDDINPTISNCPANIVQEVELGTEFITVTWIEPTAMDNSGFVTLVSRSHAPGDGFPVGPTTVTYLYQDAAGNPATCSFFITVNTVDTVPPTISNCPTGIFENVDVGTGGAVVTWVEPTATDLSGVAVLFSRSHNPSDFFVAGTSTTVTYIFNDASLNEARCSFVVTVAAVDNERPVISNCPANIAINVELGVESAIATWVEPSATDNSGVVNLVTRTVAPGTSFGLGPTSVSYIFSDESNNVAICTFTVTVTAVDTTPPSIVNCPSNIGRVVEIGTTSLAVTWTEPTATDLSGPVTLVSRSHTPGSNFPVEITTVTYIFEDSSGNPASCSFSISITAEDTIPPVISDCPSSVVRIIELGSTGSVVTWTEPSATDNSGVAFLQTRSHNPGDFFLAGPTMVMYTFVDGAANPSICSFTVNVVVEDTTPPTISNCPVSFTVTYEVGTGGTTVTWTEPTATDLSQVVNVVVRTHTPGDFFTPGATAVRYDFADAEGNIARCDFTITLVPDDNVRPTISNCPDGVAVNVELGLTSAVAFWTEPTATDASGQVTLQTRTASPGDTFPLGPNSVTYIFVDSSGNTAVCTFTVTVGTVDTTPPTISNCPTSFQVGVELGASGTVVTWTEPTATDLSGTAFLASRSHAPGTTFPVAITMVSYRFEDSAGNPSVCSFSVTVVPSDTTPPTISNCPSNINEFIELGTTSFAVTWVEPTATDASGQVLVSRTHAPGNLFPIGETIVRYTFTDGVGNPAICEFVIFITTEDTTPPVVQNCPADFSAVTELGSGGTVVTWVEPTAVDISGTASLVSRSHQPGDFFSVGPTVVTYTFVDGAGNPSTCVFTVTVTEDDNVPPTISNCPQNIVESIELGLNSVVITWVEPTATDLSGTVNLVARTAQPGDPFPLGERTITYIFADASGNSDSCSFTVTVNTVDTTPPTISNCPQESIVVSIELGASGAPVTWLEPTATDLSGTTFLQERTHIPGSTFPIGTTVVMYTFVDGNGINAMCSFLVVVNQDDTVPPTIQNCPSNIVETVELGVTSTVVFWTEPTATDLSGAVTISLRTHAPGTQFAVGSTTVEYTFSDSSGNPSECDFVITVIEDDTTPPTIQNCPANLNPVTELGNSGTVVSWLEPTAVDLSGPVTLVSQSHVPGTLFPVTATVVTYIFADSSNNRAFCEFTVTVTTVDTTRPTISNCPANVVVAVELGIGTAAAFWVEPTATDLSGAVTLVTRTAEPGDIFPLGPTTVTYIFSDNSGNSEMCQFTVTVENVDNTPPVITNCPAPIPLVVELGSTSAIAVWLEPTATDLSGAVSLTERTHVPGSPFPIGTTTVRYTFADNAGNPAVCTFVITVSTEDTTPPTIQNCPGNIVENIELGLTEVIITWTEPTATDLSGPVILTSRTAQPGSAFQVGSRTVTYIFTDSNGNPATCEFVVTVFTSDNTPPTIQNCPASQLVSVELGTTSVEVTWVEPTAFDVSGVANLLSRTHLPGSFFPIGPTEVIYTFVDGSGNTAPCSFTVTVTPDDNTPPTIQGCPSNIQVFIELGIGSGAAFWVEPTATDLSGTATLLSRSNSPGDIFPLGGTTVTYIFADESGNSDSCSFEVLVTAEDTVPPVISNCPAPIPVVVELGSTGTTVTWLEPTATDLSGAVTLTERTHIPGSTFPLGTTAVRYTFTDNAANPAVCSFTVIVSAEDRTPPTISNCPANIPRTVELGTSSVVVTWVEPTATDISGQVSLSARTHVPGTPFTVGFTTVRYTFTDGAGNIAECEFLVIVTAEDTMPPTIQNCPTDITAATELGTTSTAVTWIEPTAVDLSGVANLFSRSHIPGSQFPLQSTTVTYVFTDETGNPATCSFTITVITEDRTPPTISNCPSDVELVVELGEASAVAFWQEPTATDLSGVVNVVTRTHAPGDVFPVATTSVMYIFADNNGNTDMCSFRVIVSTRDTVPPVISNCPVNIPLSIELGSTGTIATWIEPTATDLSGTVSVVERTHAPGSTFTLGTTSVIYRFADTSGNPAVCSFSVIVSAVDTTPPTIQNCPSNIVETIELGVSSVVIIWTEPTAVDASGPVTLVSRSAIPGSLFSQGSTTVTYEFADSSGNPAVCSFSVTVLVTDTTPPTILQCPDDIQSETDITSPGVVVTWVAPTAIDLSGTAVVINQSHQSGGFFTVGLTEVRIEFADNSGNSAVCSFDVLVTQVDVNRPVILNCPANIERIIEVGLGGTEVFYTIPQATDDSGTVNLISSSHTSGQFFLVGPTIVTYIFADPSGNTEQCQFEVLVREVDTTLPVLSGCPANILEEVPLGIPGTIVTWTEPQVSDNSGIVNLISQSHISGSFFVVGPTTVTYVFADPAGNEARCSFTVTVFEVDNEPPIPVCSSDITVTIIAGEGSSPVSWPIPVVTDNSGEANIVSSNYQPGDLFPVGVTEVLYDFADINGNGATCSWNVIVIEANPCNPDPCQNGAVCVITSQTEFFCVCPECYSGPLCEIATSACTNNLCANGGACLALEGSCTQYTCECPPCFIGAFCDIPVDACDNNQCQNGGQCVQDNTCTQYTCQCPSCFTGRFCEIGYNACDNNACLNGAACTNVAGSCTEYTCTCPSCFTGAFCEIAKSACDPNPCQNNGNCVTTADSSCFSYSCQCQGCFTGFNCEIPIPPACSGNPCLNGAVCTDIPGTCAGYSCQCQPGFSGARCNEITAVNPNPCNSSPCENGASCLTMDGTYYICVCRSGYIGINCASLVGGPDPSGAIGIDTSACSSNPCVNGGSCYDSYNSNSSPQGIYVSQYTCICLSGFTGANCQLSTVNTPSLDICNLGVRPPCDNGGVCSNNYHSYDQDVDYFCACPPGFIGHNCETETTNPCDSNPCQNNAICTAFNTYFTCTCQTGFRGITCETINSVDITGPTVVNCPGTISVSVPVGTVGEAVWVEPVATDASGVAEVIYQSSTPGSQFPVGTTPVAYVFFDAYRNPTICLFFVRVTTLQSIDTTRPVISGCPSDVSVQVPVGATSGVAFWVEPTATDNSQVVPTVTSSASPGSSFNLGTTLVTYVFRDAASNEALCSFNVVVSVEVTDTTGPVISGCPDDVVVVIPGGMFASASWTPPTATDESGVAQLVSGPATSTGFFALGSTTLRYVFEDAFGNQNTCSFDVIVSTGTVDTVAPVITGCPTGVVVTAPVGAVSAVAFWSIPTATDNSGMVTLSSFTASPGDTFTIGSTEVRYTFTDPSGNPAVCSFLVTVNAGSGDITPPTISNCPATQTVSAQNGVSGAIVSWVPPTATDASGIASVVSNANPGDFFPIGTTVVSYEFRDNANLVAECIFSVVVVAGSADITPPVITNCPSDITQTAPSGTSFVSVSWTAPTAVDETSEVTVTGPGAPVGFFGIGSTTVTYIFTDAAGNPATCSFTITILSGGTVDTVAPVITGCPTGVVVTAPTGATSAIAFWNIPTATDNSGTATLTSSSASPGDIFPLGSTEVRYTFSDPSGNPAVCAFNVQVSTSGVASLVLSNCPANPIERLVGSIDDEGVVAWSPEPSAVSGLGEVTVLQSHNSGDTFPVGTTTVTYSFQDVLGNQLNCSFEVVVIRGPNPCSGDPCPENTSCFYSDDQFLCRQSTRRRRDILSSDELCPCKNNGTCHREENIPGTYCKCPPGYSGVLCDEVKIYLKKGEPQMRIDTQWSMVAVMGILVVVILVLAFTLYSMSSKVVAASRKQPDEVAIIH